MVTTRSQLIQFLADHPQGHLNTGELGRICGVSRQQIWNILESLGETRHRRNPKQINTCNSCGIQISRNSNFCRAHAKIGSYRIPGQSYECRLCKKTKPLEQFAKSAQYSSGFERRCLECRAKWQRDYHNTNNGKFRHSLATKVMGQKYPERVRAYYRVHKALKDGTLIKQPCVKCGAVESQAIHIDYNEPLNIVWLCPLCRHRTPTIKYIPPFGMSDPKTKRQYVIGQ